MRSSSDRLKTLQQKLQEYIEAEVRLGWLINLLDQQVEIYRPQQALEVLQSPLMLSGEDVLPGLTLDLKLIL